MKRIERLKWVILFLPMVLCLVSCRSTAKKVYTGGASLNDVYSEEEISDAETLFDDLDFAGGFADALRQSITYYERQRNFRYFVDGKSYSAADMLKGLLAFAKIANSNNSPAEKRKLVLKNFDVRRVVGLDGQRRILITGYHEPLLNGSLKKSGPFRYPVYAPPRSAEERRRLSRRAIDVEGALKDKGLEIVWVDDLVDLFFFHIQGSGKIALESGEILRLTFAGTNGMPFRSVANQMYERGLIKKKTNAAVKEYLKKNPKDALTILSHNERYTFFRISESGAVGALGVPLTAGRSIAVDLSLLPKGALAFIRTSLPSFDKGGAYVGAEEISRFVFCQDAGTAIKGPGRADFFFGGTMEAEAAASIMKNNGSLYILFKKK